MFNNYLWHLYLNAGGKEIVELFRSNIEDDLTQQFSTIISNLHKNYCPSTFINKNIEQQLKQIVVGTVNNDMLYPCYSLTDLTVERDFSAYEILELMYNAININNDLNDNQIFDEFVSALPYYSTVLFCLQPNIIIPYYFICNFNIVEKIAEKFEIELPELPVKKDYKGRFFYYARLCQVLYDFRIENNLSPYELCAFLYDFAPKYIGGIDSYIIKDLPQAKSAYFIGGTKDDAFLSYEEDVITPWQCSPETLAGDNIVMYLKTPISAIDSIWRSVSIGFNDPFFYYYRCTYIAKPCKITRISQKQLKNDEIFKDLSIVRKNMQGLNGVELYPSAYNHLLDISKTNLPKLKYLVNEENTDLHNEKDVEMKLVKPFLEKLGYTKNEYVQQLYIEIGNRNHALIPDFVIHPQVAKGHQSAEFLIEAKYSVKSEKELVEYKKQARSYANQLKAKYSVIASKEGIWVSSEVDDFSRDFIVLSWNELNNEDDFYRVLKFIGNGNVIKSAKFRTRLNDRENEFSMLSES